VFGPLGSSGNYFRINLKVSDDSMVEVKVNVEFTLEQTMNAERGSRCIALLHLMFLVPCISVQFNKMTN
jgi:hypothetical protein